MRYAYIKYGNVVDDLKRSGVAPTTMPHGGPETFAASFLHLIQNDPALLISWGVKSKNNLILKQGNVEAHVYKRDDVFSKLLAPIKIFFQILSFRVDFALCVHDGPGLWACYLACRLSGAKLIHSRQRAIRVKGDKLQRKLIAIIDSFIIRRIDGAICHGPFTKSQLIDVGVPSAKIVEFNTFYDDIKASAAHASTNKQSSIKLDRKSIYFVGRVEASKGVFELLKASIPILESNENIDLVYIGDGNALNQLKAEVTKANLSSQVHFKGRLPRDQVGANLKNATTLVTPTRNALEGWCMSASEGLALGIPVIAPNAGPFPFFIEHDVNGLLFEVNSVTGLQQDLERILFEDGLRDKLSRAASEFSEKWAKHTISFGDALISAREKWGNL